MLSMFGIVYFILAATALLSCIAFIVTKRNCFLYLAVVFSISVGTYLGFYRTQIRKKFNITIFDCGLGHCQEIELGCCGGDGSLDDCIYHLICPCCTLCQESRTLEMNNVQDGTWHGRGDTICIGRYGEGNKAFFELQPPPIVSTKSSDPCSPQKCINAADHSWTSEVAHSAPLVPQSQKQSRSK
ncbi:hypothetical protein CsSME_00030652 [Camellia sinensis var. sinensis]